MFFKSTLLSALTAVSFTMPAFADSQIEVQDPYAIASSAAAIAGAAFMVIHNQGDTPDRLLSVRSDVADLVQLHTHVIDENGVARMVEVTEGWEIPAGGDLLLQRGANHVMFMGLHDPFADGRILSVTLVFELAGEVVVEVPVDLSRMGAAMPAMDHSTMDHGTMTQTPSN